MTSISISNRISACIIQTETSWRMRTGRRQQHTTDIAVSLVRWYHDSLDTDPFVVCQPHQTGPVTTSGPQYVSPPCCCGTLKCQSHSFIVILDLPAPARGRTLKWPHPHVVPLPPLSVAPREEFPDSLSDPITKWSQTGRLATTLSGGDSTLSAQPHASARRKEGLCRSQPAPFERRARQTCVVGYRLQRAEQPHNIVRLPTISSAPSSVVYRQSVTS